MSMMNDTVGEGGLADMAPLPAEDIANAVAARMRRDGFDVPENAVSELVADLNGNPIAPPPPAAPDLNDPNAAAQVAAVAALNPHLLPDGLAGEGGEGASGGGGGGVGGAAPAANPVAAPVAPVAPAVPPTGTITEDAATDPNALPIDDPNRVRFVIDKSSAGAPAATVPNSSAPGAPILPGDTGGAPGAGSPDASGAEFDGQSAQGQDVYDPATARPDMTLLAEQRYNTRITAKDAATIFGVYDQVTSLPPSLQSAVSALITGDFAGAAEIANMAARAAGQIPATPQPAAPVTPPAPEAPQYFDAWGNPVQIPTAPAQPAALAVDPSVEQMRQELARAQMQQQQMQAQMVEREVGAGVSTFARSMAGILTPGEVANIHATMVGNYQSLLHDRVARGSTYRDATAEVLNIIANSDPHTQGKIIAARESAVRERQIADQQRKQLAASVGGGSGVAAQPAPGVLAAPATMGPGGVQGVRATPVAQVPRTDSEMRDLIAQDLSRTMSSSIS